MNAQNASVDYNAHNPYGPASATGPQARQNKMDQLAQKFSEEVKGPRAGFVEAEARRDATTLDYSRGANSGINNGQFSGSTND